MTSSSSARSILTERGFALSGPTYIIRGGSESVSRVSIGIASRVRQLLSASAIAVSASVIERSARE